MVCHNTGKVHVTQCRRHVELIIFCFLPSFCFSSYENTEKGSGKEKQKQKTISARFFLRARNRPVAIAKQLYAAFNVEPWIVVADDGATDHAGGVLGRLCSQPPPKPL